MYDDVYRESVHDWLDERDAERERPDPSEYDDEPIRYQTPRHEETPGDARDER